MKKPYDEETVEALKAMFFDLQDCLYLNAKDEDKYNDDMDFARRILHKWDAGFPIVGPCEDLDCPCHRVGAYKP